MLENTAGASGNWRPTARLTGRGAFVAVLSILALSLSSCGSGGNKPAEKAADQPFVIGSVNSTSGDYSAIGQNIARGIKIAIDDVNKSGGINGRQVTLNLIDDAGDPGKTQLAVKKLVEQEKVDFVLPNPISALRQVTLPYETQKKVFTMGAGGSAALGDPKKYPYSFLNGEINTKRSTAMAQLLKDEKAGTKVGLLCSNTTSQTEECDFFKALAPNFGLSIEHSGQFDNGATDLTAQLATARERGAEVVVAAAQYGSFVKSIMSSMQTLGWKAPVYIYPEGVTGEIHDQIPSAVSSQFHALFEAPCILTNTPDPEMQSFIKTASADGELKYLAPAALAHDQVWLAKWVYENAQKNLNATDGDSLKKTAETIGSVKDFPYTQLMFSPNPGWTEDVHSTANYDYSDFYGVIGNSPMTNSQYPGTLFKTTFK
jgi:ABC-type branched-subunit amino acid transport system substrate-binding protein